MKLRVISLYFPSINNEYGKKKVYTQQQKALLQQKRTETVWAAFWTNLFEFIEECKKNGEQLVVGGDWNVDVRTPALKEKFEAYQLFPGVTGKHDAETAPETYSKGSKPIDEFFVSPTLEIQAAG